MNKYFSYWFNYRYFVKEIIINIFVKYIKTPKYNMVQKLKEGKIEVPIWLITLLVGIIISTAGVITSVSSSYASTKERINQNEIKMQECKSILDRKADKSELERIYNALDRIENKIDKQISDHK